MKVQAGDGHEITLLSDVEFFNETDEDGNPTGAVELRDRDDEGVWITNAPRWMIERAK